MTHGVNQCAHDGHLTRGPCERVKLDEDQCDEIAAALDEFNDVQRRFE